MIRSSIIIFLLPSLSLGANNCGQQLFSGESKLSHEDCSIAATMNGDASPPKIPGFSQSACKATYEKIKASYKNIHSSMNKLCNTDLQIPKETLEKSCQGKDAGCYDSKIAILDKSIKARELAILELEQEKEPIRKFVKRNILAARKILEEDKEGKIPNEVNIQWKKFIKIMSSLVQNDRETHPELPSTNRKDLSVEEKGLNQEVRSGYAGLGMINEIDNEMKRQMGEKESEERQKSEDTKARGNLGADAPPPNTKGNQNSSISGFDPAKMLQLATAGLGLAQALMPKKDSNATNNPTKKEPEKINLSGGSAKPTAGISPSTEPKKSNSLGNEGSANASSKTQPSNSDITKKTSTNEEGGKSEANKPSSSGGASLSAGTAAPSSQDSEKNKAEAKIEDETLASLSGGLKYNGGGTSSSEAPHDSGMNDILKDMESHVENANGQTPENLNHEEESSFSSPFSGEGGIDSANGVSLFARMRSFYERCLKKGCVVSGIGEKI